MEKLFIFDVDDVICDLKFIIYKALTEELGIDIHYNNWNSFYLDKVYGVDIKEIYNAFFKYDILRNGNLNTQIFDVLDYLKHEKIATMALTARGWHPEGNEITRIFFEENGISIPKIQVVQHHESKSNIISQINSHNVIGFIDDNPRHILETQKMCGDKVKQYILKNQPWNKETEIDSKIVRVTELNEIPKIIESILHVPQVKRATKFKY